MKKSGYGIGIDFGTTNSAVAVAAPDSVRIAQFASEAGPVDTFRSVLYFERSLRKPKPLAGPRAIEKYLGDEDRGRLVQSIKSFLSSRQFQQTSVGPYRFTIENLIAHILRPLTAECREQSGEFQGPIVVGRPVRFVGADNGDDDDFAEGRLRDAFTEAGFAEVMFEYEPVGAAYHYESLLDHDETILIADFGGGTSDFSVLRVGPGVRKHRHKKRDLLSTSGVGLAGDAFDAKIIRHMVSPLLGAGTDYVSVDKVLPLPTSYFRKLERWHHLSFLKSKETMNTIRTLRNQAMEPEKIDNLIDLIENDLGFYLHRAVQRAKYDLSSRQETMFEFNHSGLHIQHPVTRAEFEEWISDDLDLIDTAVTEALKRASRKPDQIDRVFLTGGTSLVPAVRRIFDHRFSAERVRTGGEFTSVARGLALRAAAA